MKSTKKGRAPMKPIKKGLASGNRGRATAPIQNLLQGRLYVNKLSLNHYDFMHVLSETVFKDWVTFQYHEDAMKLQDLITISVSVGYRKGIIYQSSTAKKMDTGAPGIFNFNMLFARKFLHIFFFLVGVFDVFFRFLKKGGRCLYSQYCMLEIQTFNCRCNCGMKHQI